MPLLIATVAAIGFAVSAVAAYFYLRHHRLWASPVLLAACLMALVVNASYSIWSIYSFGIVETFRQNFQSTLLLASLIAVVGLCTHLSAALKGLDGFLFISASVVQLGALTVLHRESAAANYRPWFVSHSLAFQVSAACFIAAGASGVAYLLVNSLLRRKQASRLVGAVAPLESLERFGRWMLMIGFPLFTYGVLTGMCELVRSKDPGPGAWIRDPLILGSFITWGVYALVIGGIWLRPEIRGRRAAALATCGMALIAMVFLVFEFVSPFHR